MTQPSREPARIDGRLLLAWAACYAIATVALTWPLFESPATRVLNTHSLYGEASQLIQRDINLTMWTLAWSSHALATDPLNLFDANI